MPVKKDDDNIVKCRKFKWGGYALYSCKRRKCKYKLHYPLRGAKNTMILQTIHCILLRINHKNLLPVL